MTKKEQDSLIRNPTGILLVNKSYNKSSFSLIPFLRKKLQIKKIGHAGTLDPLATGVMIFLIGKEYTTKAPTFVGLDKEYLATLFLGRSTDTFDREGKTTFTSLLSPTLEDVHHVLSLFQGDILQTPPMFSAKKVGGKRLYALARQGIEVEREPIKVRVKTTLISFSYPYLELQITCSKGTYIRTIAQDIGEKLGCGAYLESLCRTRVGPFFLEQCVKEEDLQDVEKIRERLIERALTY